MQAFFQTLQQHDRDSEQRLDEVLKGGKGEIKRASSVDKSLYGTEAGVKAKQQYEQEQAIIQQQKKEKKLAAAKQAEKEKANATNNTVAKVAGVGAVVVGVAAATVAFLAGGSRSSR